MQDAVLESQINSGVVENANNNATALGAAQIAAATSIAGANINAGVATTELTDATTLASQQQNIQANEDTSILNYTENTGLANTPNRDNLNAVTGILQTIATGGSAPVASTAITSSGAQQISANQASAAKVGSITSGISSVLTGLFA
jgi:hypothetical protein